MARLANIILLVPLLAYSLVAHATGDQLEGKRVYDMKCKACHSIKPGEKRLGPSLYGIVGRRTASLPDYAYSPAAKAAGGVWSAKRIDQFVQSPRTVIPGTKMAFGGIANPDDREAIIIYLQTLKP